MVLSSVNRSCRKTRRDEPRDAPSLESLRPLRREEPLPPSSISWPRQIIFTIQSTPMLIAREDMT